VVLREYNVGDKVVMTVGVDKAAAVMINCWNTSKIIFVMSFFVMKLYEVVLISRLCVYMELQHFLYFFSSLPIKSGHLNTSPERNKCSVIFY
jgi:hypothetical protein